MKKLLTVLCFTCALAVAAQADESTPTKKKHQGKTPTAEQKAILEKYDTNKDGKLDKEERAKMSAEVVLKPAADKAKLQKSGTGHKKKEVEKPESATNATK